jgi:hypothetical protein
MKRFKLGFRNRSVREKIAICRRVEDSFGKLPEKHRALAVRIPVASAIEEAIAADARVEALRLELRSAVQDRKVKTRAMCQATTRKASLVLAETMGDPALLLAAGLELEADKRAVGIPGAPEQLSAAATAFEGKVWLGWKRPVRRCAFLVEMTRDLAATKDWKQVTISIRQSCELEGLESGARHWFRVAATNTQGQGPWSNPVCVRPA